MFISWPSAFPHPSEAFRHPCLAIKFEISYSSPPHESTTNTMTDSSCKRKIDSSLSLLLLSLTFTAPLTVPLALSLLISFIIIFVFLARDSRAPLLLSPPPHPPLQRTRTANTSQTTTRRCSLTSSEGALAPFRGSAPGASVLQLKFSRACSKNTPSSRPRSLHASVIPVLLFLLSSPTQWTSPKS